MTINIPAGLLSPYKVAAELCDAGCLQFGTFGLKNGEDSPVYVDMRAVCSSPALLRVVIDLMAGQLHPLGADWIAGVALSGIPLATGLSLALNIPFCMVRDEFKPHGTQRIVDPLPPRNSRVVLVDDVCTDGATKIEAVKKLRMVGAQVTDAVVFLDRQTGGRAQLLGNEVCLWTCFTLRGLVVSACDARKITEEKMRATLNYLQRGEACQSASS